MLLSELFANIECRIVGLDTEVTDIAYDSRQVQPGGLFVAIKGFKEDGHSYIPVAINNGAVAVVVEQLIPNITVTQVVVSNCREVLGKIAAFFWDHPAHEMTIIGVTGTNGKTTTTYLIKSILEKAGFKVGLIGTIEAMIGSDSLPNVRTTPESLDLQKMLASMRKAKIDYVVMEVSSHALELHRTTGVKFDIGVFTNLTQDHLDFHPSLEHYFQAKAKLFRDLQNTAIINTDDEYGKHLASMSNAPVLSYGVDQPVQIGARDIQITNKGACYQLRTPSGNINLNLALTGQFNVYNSLAAAAACLAAGVKLEYIQEGLETIAGVPGRFELIDFGQEFSVIVDYAHTPDGLENILMTARNLAEHRVIVVFGAGGDRDTKKRPLMGAIASRLGDRIIVTSDNPRTEEPVLICQAIVEGITKENANSDYIVVVERREAIKQAIAEADQGDVVIIAGKGHEDYQEINNVRNYFSDREEALTALKELIPPNA